MDIFVENALGNLVGGVGAAALITFATIGLNEMRTTSVRNALKASIGDNAIAYDESGFGITITNRTSIYIIVRSVRFHTKGIVRVALNPRQAGSYCGWDHESRADDAMEFLRFSAAIDSTDERRGFRILPAYTSYTWLIPPYAMIQGPFDFTTLEILVEYPTLLGGRRLLTIHIPPSDDLVSLEEAARQYLVRWARKIREPQPKGLEALKAQSKMEPIKEMPRSKAHDNNA